MSSVFSILRRNIPAWLRHGVLPDETRLPDGFRKDRGRQFCFSGKKQMERHVRRKIEVRQACKKRGRTSICATSGKHVCALAQQSTVSAPPAVCSRVAEHCISVGLVLPPLAVFSRVAEHCINTACGVTNGSLRGFRRAWPPSWPCPWPRR